MFKLESYITPILLSYVDRYIKNFRLEDSQVSLWGGDASFHNLDLRLEVLEQELQLPFSFVSGHIRELLIHVPWTKLASEPITITINTIECILKLKGSEASASSEGTQTKEKHRKTGNTKHEVEAPPSYVQLLINKIVSNIRIYCNNLILKYVEEDIVLSMNIKLLKFESANDKWEPAYTDISPAQVILRKIIAVNDLTLCLDKRNAAGKIDVYQEPMLYRCSMTMHLLKHYHSATANRASTTRLDIYCNYMEFGMTEQQVPMLMRLIMLLLALTQKDLKPECETPTDVSNIPSELKETVDDGSGTWTGWAWSYVSSVLPAPWDEEWNNEELQSQTGHTVHIGFYVDNLSITFKVSESSGDRGYYSQKKLRYLPMLVLQLQGIYSESIVHGIKWSNSSFGVSQAILLPVGLCSCSHDELVDSNNVYLKLGSVTNAHKNDSLFDVEAVENKGQKRQYNTSWDYHMTTNSESALLERTPALAFDFVYQMEVPEDMTSERLSEIASNYEYSNLSEVSSSRVCIGPFKLKLCSGFFHRISSLQVAASYYDYPPYSEAKPDLPLGELLPPSEEDFDALCEFISNRSMRITFFAPIIELQLMDHPSFTPGKGNLFRKRKKMSPVGSTHSTSLKPDLPKITIECQFLDISIQSPMYVNRLIHTTCQLPEPPPQLFNACYTQQNIKVIGLSSRLILNPQRHTTILTPCSLSYSCKSILKPQYWINPDIPHVEVTFESESVTINGTKAKMLIVWHIVDKVLKVDADAVMNSIYTSSLLLDATKEYGLPFMELCIEGVRFRKVTTNSTVSIDVSLGSIKAFIFEPLTLKMQTAGSNLASKDIQQVLFISGPEPAKESSCKANRGSFEDQPLFTATMQYPLNPDLQTHPAILIFNLQEVRICVDPLLCRWLLYSPRALNIKAEQFDSIYHKTKNLSEASGSLIETPRRLSQIESVHSCSSDRELSNKPHSIPKSSKPDDNIDMQEKIYNELKTWFDVWKGMLLCGDVSQCTIYFPMVSLSAVGSQGIQEAIEQAITKESPPDIMVLTLPFANVRSAQRQTFTKHMRTLPVKLCDSVWSIDKSSFPWTMSISELSCYTIQRGHKLIFLKAVSLSATVGLSTRSSKPDLDEASVLTASPSTNKADIGYLGVCIHIDMSPVVVSTSEGQVYLFASILYGLMEVAGSLMPVKGKPAQRSPDVVPPIITARNSQSPTIVRENTLDTTSDKTPPKNTNISSVDTEGVKLTAWVQWTITRFTIELLAYNRASLEESALHQPCLKLVIDAEDIVSSLDFQSVYLKIKSKVGSVSIQHYQREYSSAPWVPGPFTGIVMRLREDVPLNQRHEDNGFISVTVTRASCKHTHTLWGALQKRHKEKKPDNYEQLFSPTRYITEIVINIQPVDFIISLNTLKNFYLVVMPLMEIPQSENKPKEGGNLINYLNNQVLPLAYLDCQDIRVIIPSNELRGVGSMHDVVVLQVQKISLSPTAVNPICRTPTRPDIYEQAAHARILNIPGSEVEDRQYQFDVTGMSVSTGVWEDIDNLFCPSGTLVLGLRSMSENPAVEWNNLEQGQPNMAPNLNLWPVTERFDISIVAAPAMVVKHQTLICGSSIEVNFVSDITVNISLQQIKLASALLSECLILVDQFLFYQGVAKRGKIKFPYSKFEGANDIDEDDEYIFGEMFRDSGIETSDMRSVLSAKAPGAASTVKTLTESDKQYVFPRPPNPLPQGAAVVPVDVLLTGGKISVSLYQVDKPGVFVQKHRLKRKVHSKMSDDEEGYEASEEGDENKDKTNHYTPLIYLSITQPNAFFSKYHLGRRVQISCFDVNLGLSGPEYLPVTHVPTEEDYPVKLLETRPGTPHETTGISPAFVTMRFSRGAGKNANLDLEFAKPMKILCSGTKWLHLFVVKDKIFDAFNTNDKAVQVVGAAPNSTMVSSEVSKSSTIYSRLLKSSTEASFTKFIAIKEAMMGTNNINVKFDQIVFAIKADTSGYELHLGVEKIRSSLSVSSRPEKLTLICALESLTLTASNDSFKRLLLNPWTISFDVCLFWEAWQSFDSDPQIQISAESDCIVIDISPEQIKCLRTVLGDIKEFIANVPLSHSESEEIPSEHIVHVDKDQHYKDDLRAGAFQFVDSSTNNTDELPLPYQVMFWRSNISAMAWRYPQPRALTKVRVFPVPYKNTLGTQQNDLLVLCHLEYWSDCRSCYLPFTQFYLSESEVCHLTLPEAAPQPVVASTWRVVVTMINDKEEVNTSKLSVSPRALAACMRIDSYFNKSLIPNITAAVYITKIDVSLYSYVNKTSQTKLPVSLRQFTPDMFFPETQCFLTLSLDNLTAHFSTWNFEMFLSEISHSTRCLVLDYSFLTNQSLIEPFTSKIEVIFSPDNLQFNLVSKPIHLLFGPNLAHTLAVSAQLWSQNFLPMFEPNQNFIVITCYVICNDTNVNIRFGQSATDEDILLQPRHFHMYSWRSQKRKQQLKVALEENEWIWSKSFGVFEDGIQTVELCSEKNLTVVISVKSLSATQKKVTVCAQLVVCNMLLEHFELKVVEAGKEEKDANFKLAATHIVPGKSTPPSIFINMKKKYYLRLRFYGLESAWTGDIPLREHANSAQPWLVKVPLQERSQFLSVWCRIVIQDTQKVKRVLAMLWPLFTVRSNLPIDAKLHIETPMLNVHLDSTVNGKGEMQQLYCPGTIDHSHQLTFLLDNGPSAANPYVPLNYSLVDQQTFFKPLDKEDIDEILSVLDNCSTSRWPYFGDELDDIEWIVGEQPLTHVQVRYSNACQYSSSLLVELLPWCLMVNIFGTSVTVMHNGIELCRLHHHGIIAPPKLEGNFNIGVKVGGQFFYSSPLQLAKSDWSQAFYMPKITGTVPLEGNVKTPIFCNDSSVCMVSITSCLSNEIRLLKVASTHVLSNHMDMQLEVVCLAVPDTESIWNFPSNADGFSFTLSPCLQKSNSGVSIIKWMNLGENVEIMALEFALYLSFCFKPELGWSCPIRVDKPLPRTSFSVLTMDQSVPVVLTSYEHKGQIYLSIQSDAKPQMFIENKSKINLYCAQYLGEDNLVAEESKHFNWNCKIPGLSSAYYTMPVWSQKFPELATNNNGVNQVEKIVLASDIEDDSELQWSVGVPITNDNEQFVRIPYYGDVKLIITNTACTTILTIECVSQVEFSARDIRVRLSMHEMEKTAYLIPPNKPNETTETHSKASSLKEYTERSSTSKSSAVFQRLSTVDERSMNFSVRTTSSRGYGSASSSFLASQQSLIISSLPFKKELHSVKVNAFIKLFSVTFTSDMENGSDERCELANFTVDNITFGATQTEILSVKMSVTDLQFDNQMYLRESYDFPVVLIGQEVKENKKFKSLNTPVEELIASASENALVYVEMTFDTFQHPIRGNKVTGARHVNITINPISCYVEDIYVTKLMEYLKMYIPTNLIMWPIRKKPTITGITSGFVIIPVLVSWQCAALAAPLTIRNITIHPVSLLLSIHSSIKLYIALDQSPLQFGKFERKRLMTTPYRLGHALTMHYLSGAIFGAGWVVSSLELLGSPGGLARAMGTGLRDFVSMPYRGLIEGPMAFLWGITHGSASLMRHITAGTLQSVTKLASSVARNLDRLTLDEEHLKRAEEQRRQRPQGLAQGFKQGLTGLGISLLGAVGGIAHHPLQSVMSEGASPRSLAAGVGLGLVGVFTKPLSGAAELVALTGQGLLQGAGWNSLPEPRASPVVSHMYSGPNTVLKYNWKLMNSLSQTTLLFVTEATNITHHSQYDAVALILTIDALIIINTDEDKMQKVISLAELSIVHSSDPTLLSFQLTPVSHVPVKPTEEEGVVEMDPACRSRVAEYVKNTVGFLYLPDSYATPEHSEISISPLSSPSASNEAVVQEPTVLSYYVNPQNRNYFLCLLSLAKQQCYNYNFPVL